jgi:hypothetical protein
MYFNGKNKSVAAEFIWIIVKEISVQIENHKKNIFFYQTSPPKMFNRLIGHICLVCLEPS